MLVIFRLIKDYNSPEPFEYNQRLWEDSGECAALFAMMDVFEMDAIRLWVMCGLGDIQDDEFTRATAIGVLPAAIKEQHDDLVARCIKSIIATDNTQRVPAAEGNLHDFVARRLIEATWIERGIKFRFEHELDYHEDLLARRRHVGDKGCPARNESLP